jgi:hypothetical protein
MVVQRSTWELLRPPEIKCLLKHQFCRAAGEIGNLGTARTANSIANLEECTDYSVVQTEEPFEGVYETMRSPLAGFIPKHFERWVQELIDQLLE